MQEFERIDLAFQDAGHSAETIEEILRVGEVGWELLISGGVELRVHHEDEQQMLVFAADVGTPVTTNLLPLYTALLQFNQLHTETGGAMMTVDTEGGIELVFRMNTALVEPHVLQYAVENLAHKVLLWRTALHGEPTDADESDHTLIDARMMV